MPQVSITEASVASCEVSVAIQSNSTCMANRLSGYVISCERHGASRGLLAVFSPAASALRLTVSGLHAAC